MKPLIGALLLMSCCKVFAAPVSASDLSTSCQKLLTAVNAKGEWDGKHAKDIYSAGQCEGFIEGWIEGIDGAILTYNGQLVAVSIQRNKLESIWAVADALAADLQKNPLDGGKPADETLRTILLGSDLISVTPYVPPASPQNNNAVYQQ